MKRILLFIVGILIGILGFVVYATRSLPKTPQEKAIAKISTRFSLTTAPKDSLKGSISTLSGEVAWQSRTATEPAKIDGPIPIQQGENIVTKDTGSAVVDFPNIASIQLTPDTSLSIIQTLPLHVVFQQDNGFASYQTIGESPISIRSSNLLTKIAQGKGSIAVSKDQTTIVVKNTTATISVGYNDSDTITHVVDIPKGNTFTFDIAGQEGQLSQAK